MHNEPARLFFIGPTVVSILIATLVVLALLLVLCGQMNTLVSLSQRLERASERLADGSRIIPTLWGLVAGVFFVLAPIALFSTKVLAILGVIILIAGLAMASLGLGASALWLGSKISESMGVLEADVAANLRLGLWSMLLASILPFAGWLVVVAALASGIGAISEVFATSRRE